MKEGKDVPDLVLRGEREADFRTTEELTREAFWNAHVPGCDEHYILHRMRDSAAFVSALDTVAEMDGRVVGSIVYTKADIARPDGALFGTICFGPVAVLPAYQGKGVGSALIRHTLARARELGFRSVLIYGDPDYYGRFGFSPAEKYGIGTADGMYADALLALELVPGALDGVRGRFYEAEVFNVNADAARAFDLGFPAREARGDLQSQARFRTLVLMQRPMEA
jgi:predicted N-acetyltransferase YhbS